MKAFAVKNKVNFVDLFIGVAFFTAVTVISFIYSIDFSLVILIFILLLYVKMLRKPDNLPSYVDLAILGLLAILIPLLTTVTFKLSGYAISAVGFVILITLLFEDLELSLFFALLISFFGASIDGGNFNVAIVLFISSLTAAMFSFKARRRFQVIKAGLFAGAVQFIAAFIIEREQSFFIVSRLDFNLFKTCLMNGVISSVVVLGLLPIFEYVLKVVTNISLLELSDFNHPLLRKLILEAPGTYQHSLVVANLSESAAESIGARSLLARVGAYYHDVGKMVKPDYFVENLVGYRDAHKNLKPSISKIIILNHVKEGIELAKKHRLNPNIIDFVSQHHGKTLVYYFYHRAKELEPDGKHEEEYRYAGPKPQSKEIAIVSLADTIEALSRALEDPTPSRIEEAVREIVRKRFMEGELDESDLTLKDLEKITQSFIRILNATFHTRINYPKNSTGSSKFNKPNKA